MPSPLDPQAALKKLAEVRQRRAALSSAAQERFAAREMGVDVPTFRAALKGKPSLPAPTIKPPAKALIPDPQKNAYDAGWQASKVTKTYDLESAEARFEAKYGRDAHAQFAAGWADHASDYEKYTSFKPKPGPPAPPTSVTTRSINSILDGAGFKRSINTAVRTTHTGQVYGGGSSITSGYRTRQIIDNEVIVTYFEPGASREAVQAKIAQLIELLENTGHNVRRGNLLTEIIVSVKPSSALNLGR
jgi:hypothetical protein